MNTKYSKMLKNLNISAVDSRNLNDRVLIVDGL